MTTIQTICRSIYKATTHRSVSIYARCHRSSLAFLIAIAIAATAGMQAWALDPALPPGDNFDLSHWYLGLPVDDTGGTSGVSASIDTDSLVAGFTNEYFYTGTDGSMVFWAPVNGATTPNSDYPRSELRELIDPDDDNENWPVDGTHILSAECAVTQVPTGGTAEVIVGQIHSKTGLQRPLVKIYYNGYINRVRINVKQDADDPNNNDDDQYWFNDVMGLHSNFTYGIQMEDGLLTLSVNGQTTNVLVSSTWDDEEFYFKAGSYCQDNDGPSTEGARVAFYDLTTSHDFIDRSYFTVVSPYGSPTPPVGTEVHYNAPSFVAWVASPVTEGGARHTVTGWDGTGDVIAGTGYGYVFDLTQDSSITWLWDTEYQLTTAVSGSGSVDVASGTWFDAGSNATITATPDPGNLFLNWSGDSSSTNPVLNLTMDSAKSVTANFAVDLHLPPPEFVGGGVQFTVTSSVSGLLYQLEYTDLLKNPILWSDMGSPVAGNGGDIILTDPGPITTNRFYQLYIQP